MKRIFGCRAGWLALLPVAAGAQLPRSLIEQGTFEGTLQGWEVDHGQVAVEAGSVRLTDSAAVQTPLIPYARQFLRIAFRMKTEGVERGKEPWNLAGLQVVWYDPEQQEIGHNDVGLTAGTTDWTPHEGRSFHEAKEGMAFFRVRLLIWDTRGTAWFDDVVVEETGVPEAFRKVPLLSEVEDQTPRLWALPELQPLAGPLDVGTLQVNFAPDRGAFIRPTDPRAPELTRLDVTVNAGEPLGYSESGLEAAAGYYYRYRAVSEGRSGRPVFEAYTEAFRGSPIVAQFLRLYVTAESRVARFRIGFEVPAGLTRLAWFRGNALQDGELGPAVRYRFGETTKPFIVLHSADDTSGLVVYHPTPPEVRRWHLEDYVVESRPDLVCLPEAQPDGRWRISWDFRDVTAGAGGYEHSFDLPLYFMPYVGTVQAALREFQVWDADLTQDTPPLPPSAAYGYWSEWMGGGPGERALRMARYHPREFASWIPGAPACYGHKDGHMWGAMTQQMKGIRVDPLAERALLRDDAIRMLHFFVERANEQGAPPDMSMWRDLAILLPDPQDYFTHVFCQYWEFRLGEFRRLMASPHLTEEEKSHVYDALQRARRVFDPGSPRSWTKLTPEGSYWFDYMDLPLWAENPWVINTHATSVGVAGQFHLLARERHEDSDALWWADVFRRGVDGLLYALSQDWMWYADTHDANELRYGRSRGGPRDYHGYMVTAWMPEVIRTAIALDNYRLDDLVAAYRRMTRARYLENDERTRAFANDFLQSIGRGE